MNVIDERIAKLREIMKMENIDFYIIPTADFHSSEYVSDYFKVRNFMSGFTGSAGTLVVSQSEAGLWTDGRYFVQAAKEIENNEVVLYKMGEEGVPKLEEYLVDRVSDNQIIGFDGRVITASFGNDLAKKLADRNIHFSYEKDLVDEIWTDRPELPCTKVWVVSDEMNGETAAQKLARVREEMKKKHAAHLMMSKLDDIMWLYNIRANDVTCNPVALSYTFISENEAVLFVQKGALSEDAVSYLAGQNVICKDYQEVTEFVKMTTLSGKVWCSGKDINYLLYHLLKQRTDLIDQDNPTTLMKAIKNKTELENIRRYYIEDSAVLTKFLFWMKENAGKVPMDEITVADKLDQMRSEIDGFLDLSFPTISAYKANAAMAHYSATPEEKSDITNEGLYLVDSGAQYKGATTDVTRTIALGEISDEIKLHFTKVVCSMLRMADTKFLYGCTGRNLDIIARGPLWDCGLDYKHGTGHGIGYILNVHEGPHSLRWQYVEGQKETILEEGMIVSDEPGMYVADSHGIRIENIVETVKETKNEYGQFMGFRHLTYVPIDLDAIDTRFMETSDIKKLNEYHKMVFEKISPYFEGEELEMLRNATRALPIVS